MKMIPAYVLEASRRAESSLRPRTYLPKYLETAVVVVSTTTYSQTIALRPGCPPGARRIHRIATI
jgi:hypothetical protein